MWDLALERDGEKIEEGVDKPEEGGGGRSLGRPMAVTHGVVRPQKIGLSLPFSFLKNFTTLSPTPVVFWGREQNPAQRHEKKFDLKQGTK